MCITNYEKAKIWKDNKHTLLLGAQGDFTPIEHIPIGPPLIGSSLLFSLSLSLPLLLLPVPLISLFLSLLLLLVCVVAITIWEVVAITMEVKQTTTKL